MRRAVVWKAVVMTLVGVGLTSIASLSNATDEAETPPPPGTIEFVGRNLIARAKGTFHSWRLTRVAVDPARITEGEVLVEVDLASIDTGIKRRDDHLRSADFFDVERFPTAQVRVSRARREGTGEHGHPRYLADFEIDLHGVKKTLEGEFELSGSSPPRAIGKLTLSRMDFGIGKPFSRWNPMSVREEIPITFETELGGF